MDFLPSFFLFVFVIVGGVIAVAADHVGKKLGKKRLRVFGLRPRHTAMLGTFSLGVMIALLTILLVALSTQDVRTWIIKGRKILNELDTANAEKNKALVQRDTFVQTNKQLESNIKDQRNLLTVQTGKLATMQSQISRLQPEIAKYEATVSRANAKIASLDRERLVAQRELNNRRIQLKSLEARLLAQKSQLATVAAEVKNAQQVANENMQRNLELMSKNSKLVADNQKLQGDIESTQREISNLTAETDTLEKARDQAKQELVQAQTRLTDSEARLSRSESDLSRVQSQLNKAQVAEQFLSKITGQARFEPMIYQRGDEVARITVPSGVSIQSANDFVVSLLRSARVAATQLGAKANELYAAAGIVEHTDPNTNTTLTPDQLERQIVQRVAGSSEPLAVVATSSVNAFRGEPVSLEISVLPNPVVYTRGQVVAETRVDGSLDDGEVFDAIVDFLRNKIKDRATADHMIPRFGPGETFGAVSIGDVHALANRVKATNRRIRVQAVAPAETRAADPLKLEFRLR